MFLSLTLVLLVADTTHVVVYTELGPIAVELYEGRAPVTVENFLHYVRSGSYDGGSFFRVVRDDNQPNNPVKITVIQGGVSEAATADLPPIILERTSVTAITHGNGTISMAR